MNIIFTELRRLNYNSCAIFSSSLNTTEEYYREMKNLLKLKRIKNKSFVRVGRAECDGGYIMVDDFERSKNLGGGVAYSFGISEDVTWDSDMAKNNFEIYMYDPTIDGLPEQNPKFHFFKEGIAGEKNPEKSLDTLENFIKRNGHEKNSNMILKMDVEGAEWGFLDTVSEDILNRFDQIVFEFHDLIQHKTSEEMNRQIKLLEKLNKTHSAVHVHGNNNGNLLQVEDVGCFPDVLEVSYVRSEFYELEDDENIFLPIPLDKPNHSALRDYNLGYWNKFMI